MNLAASWQNWRRKQKILNCPHSELNRTMQSKPFLELCGISLRLNNRLVFQNTDWIFRRNQNWAWIGTNGSGKTLLARAISGEIPLYKGEVRYGFRTPSGTLPEDRIVLLSFEEQKVLSGNSHPAVRWFSSEREAAQSVKQFLSQSPEAQIAEALRAPPAAHHCASWDCPFAAQSHSLFIQRRNAQDTARPCTSQTTPSADIG